MGSRAYAPGYAPARSGDPTSYSYAVVRGTGPRPGRLIWRPLPAALFGSGALVALGLLGHLERPGWWWMVGLVLAAGVHLPIARLNREIERVYARCVGAAAALWLSIAWAYGPEGETVLVLVVAALGAVVPWAIHRRVRGAVTIGWPALPAPAASRRLVVARAIKWLRDCVPAVRLQRRAGREFRRLQGRWIMTAMLREINLAGSRIVAAHWNWRGPTWVRLQLEGARTKGDVAAVLGQVEAMWHLPAGTLQLREVEGAGAHLVELHLRPLEHLEPLPDMVPWDGVAPEDLHAPWRLGVFGGAREVRVHPVDPKTGKLLPHVMCAGQTGWGKGGFVNLVLAQVALSPWWECWGIDAKDGMELGPWEPVFRHLTDDPDAGSVRLLKLLVEEMHRRNRLTRSRGKRSWTPTPEEPLILLVVDEWAELSVPAKEVLDTLVRQCRASGILLLLCTQRPSAAKTDPKGLGDTRSQLGTVISYYQRRGDGDLTFGVGAREWMPHTLTERGRALIFCLAEGLTEPEPFQTFWVTDEAVAAIVERYVSVRSLPKREPSDEQDHPAPALAGEWSSRTVPYQPPAPMPEAESPEPGRPVLHLVEAVDPSDALVRLCEILDAAPEEGVKRSELIARTRMSASWVDQQLRYLRAAGRAYKVPGVGRARWRGRGQPVQSVVQEESR